MAPGTSPVPALFRSGDQSAAQVIETEARLLVAKAEAMGLHLTIERKSLHPPAMRNHVAVIKVWEKR